MTVFKEDYRLMELYIDYYSKLGVDAFFFYYNDKLDEKMFEFIKDSSHSIHITEWNYQYWTNPNIVLNLSLPGATFKLKFGRSNDERKSFGSSKPNCLTISFCVKLSVVAVNATIGTNGNCFFR